MGHDSVFTFVDLPDPVNILYNLDNNHNGSPNKNSSNSTSVMQLAPRQKPSCPPNEPENIFID